ncbi:hypothetical protein IF650_08385 [Cellulosimicrobium terreum]|nr:hypothetical protein [Cellulosimicrobium terreum]
MRFEYTSAVPDDEPGADADAEDDEVEPLRPLDAAGARALAGRYLLHSEQASGTRAERLEDEMSAFVWDEITDRVLYEPDPFPMLDALVELGYERVPVDDHAFLALVAAGPVENAVVERPDLRDAIAERCRRDPGWHLTAQGVWVDADLAATFPEPLDGLVTLLGTPGGSRPPARAGRRASKHQDHRGRGRHR